jgi:hypothetical protein
MYKKNSIIKLLALGSILLSVITTSCVKTHDGDIEDASTSRVFTPYSFSVKTSIDSAKFTWSAPVLSAGKKYSYTVDVSTDTLFSTIAFTKTVDTLGFFITEPTLAVATKYFARMRVEPFKGAAASAYLYGTFKINGQNYLRALRDFELTPTTALIHFYANANTADINKILLVAGGVQTFVDISGADAAAGLKLITGLTPGTKYELQLLAGTKSKGITSFTTPKALVYTTILQSGGDLAGAITAAADGAVIGLSPGNYALNSIYTLSGKSVTIASTSNKPADTKITVRQFQLANNGAGVTFQGVDINGNYSGTTLGNYFIVLNGAAAAGDPCNYTDIKLDNCVIHDFLRTVILGNNATVANTQTINSITINNSVIYNIDKAGTGTYYTMSLEKLLFNTFSISKSTFYSMGCGMFNMGTALTATTVIPTITVDACTFNNFGGSGKYLFIDAVANKISYTLKNSILANSPQTGTINGTAFRSTGATTLSFANCNYFKMYSNSTGTLLPLIFTGLNQTDFNTIDLGWTAATTNFSLASQPATSKIFSMSSSGSTVGDPRWAY